jgi:hypothetical protein
LRRRDKKRGEKNRDCAESYIRSSQSSFNRAIDVKKVEAQPKENNRDIKGYERVKTGFKRNSLKIRNQIWKGNPDLNISELGHYNPIFKYLISVTWFALTHPNMMLTKTVNEIFIKIGCLLKLCHAGAKFILIRRQKYHIDNP